MDLHAARCISICHYRFIRYRQSGTRLQVSLIETRRIGGKVRHEHIASFGSVEMPPLVKDRLAFWQRLHERLTKLSNRIDAAAQAKLLGDIHAKIPMVTLDEQQALKLENAKADERLWESIRADNDPTPQTVQSFDIVRKDQNLLGSCFAR